MISNLTIFKWNSQFFNFFCCSIEFIRLFLIILVKICLYNNFLFYLSMASTFNILTMQFNNNNINFSLSLPTISILCFIETTWGRYNYQYINGRNYFCLFVKHLCVEMCIKFWWVHGFSFNYSRTGIYITLFVINFWFWWQHWNCSFLIIILLKIQGKHFIN